MAHGSVQKLDNGKFRVCFEYGFDDKGSRIRKHKTFETKKEADLALSRHNVTIEDGTTVMPRVITLGEWLNYWLDNMLAPRAAETTVYGNRNIIDKHIIPALGNIPLQKLKPMAIQKYYISLMEEKGLSPNSVIKQHDMLKTALHAAVKQEYLSRNPMLGVDRPKKIIHEASIYTAEQMQRLMELIENDRLQSAVKLGAYLGLRREEICGLYWSDVDWETKTLYIRRARTQVGSQIIEKDTKTNASVRKLYIPEGLFLALKKELDKQEANKKDFGKAWLGVGHIVAWEDGSPYRPNYVSELFTKFLKDNDLPKIVLHEMRHTFASLSNEAGVQEYNIGKALGHSNVNTTKKIYTHLFDDKHTAAVDAVANMIDGKKEKALAEYATEE